MMQVIVFWSNRKIKMPQNVVLRLNHKIKMLVKFYLEETRNIFLPMSSWFFILLIRLFMQKVKLKAKLISPQCCVSYRNHMHCKSNDWFLYEKQHLAEMVQEKIRVVNYELLYYLCCFLSGGGGGGGGGPLINFFYFLFSFTSLLYLISNV